MSRTQEWTALPSCVHNIGATCEGVSPRCKYCGWNPAVSKRRIDAIKAGNLRTNEEGKKYLSINGRGEPNAVQ